MMLLMGAILTMLGGGNAGITLSQSVTSALVAYWKMDEASGTRNDSHSGAKHLSIGTNAVGSRAGKFSNAAADFNSPVSWLNRSDAALHSQAGQGFTVAGWVLFDTLTDCIPFSSWDFAAGQSEFSVDLSTSTLHFNIDTTGSGATNGLSGGTPATGSYIFLAGGYRYGTEIFFRVNTGSSPPSAQTGNLHLSTLPFAVGNISNAGAFGVDGAVDEVAYFNRGLSEAELDYLYNGGTGRTYPL